MISDELPISSKFSTEWLLYISADSFAKIGRRNSGSIFSIIELIISDASV